MNLRFPKVLTIAAVLTMASLVTISQIASAADNSSIYATTAERKSFTTKDGAELSYLELGKGQPMVLIHGWSQSGLQWYNQIEEFSDLRGHGNSSKVDNGYRAYRLAQDVREFMVGLNLDHTVLMGHSMGCTILWAYWDIYGEDGVDKMIFVDNTPYPSDNPAHTSVHVSKGLTAEAVSQMAVSWANDDKVGTFSNHFFRQQFTSNVSEEVYEKALEQHLLLPRQHAVNMQPICL